MRNIRLARVFWAVVLVMGAAVLAGCNPQRAQLTTFNAHFERGDYEQAAAYAEKRLGKRRANPSGEDLLWTMQLAGVERLRGNLEISTQLFDKCEDMLKHYDQQWRSADVIGTTVVNENIIPYRGEEYDGVMVNTYKALNFMAIGNMDLARVEFNRALDRQRIARENFAQEIRKLQAELEKRNNKNKVDVRSTVDDPNTMRAIHEQYPNMFAFEAYPDFVNPFATYLAGIFSYATGDYAKAADLLKESYGMVPDNPYVGEDLIAAENVLAGSHKPEPTIWVIFENGLGPVKMEQRFDLPLILSGAGIYYTGIALPVITPRGSASHCLVIEADGQTYPTATVADMDRIVQTEFKNDFRGILTRAIISSAAKAVTQYALSKNDDAAWLALLMAAYSAASTTADVRIWTTLPKEFQVARLKMPQAGKLTVKPAHGQPFEVGMPDCQNLILYVRMVALGIPPVWEVISFGNVSVTD